MIKAGHILVSVRCAFVSCPLIWWNRFASGLSNLLLSGSSFERNRSRKLTPNSSRRWVAGGHEAVTHYGEAERRRIAQVGKAASVDDPLLNTSETGGP